MAGFLSKVTKFAGSPQGRKAIAQARAKAEHLAKDPATRAKLDAGVDRVRGEVGKRRRGAGSATPPPPTTPPSTTPPSTTPPSTTPPSTTPPSTTPPR